MSMAQEASKDGYILLHRRLMVNPVFHHPNHLKLWIYCLLKANHKPGAVLLSGKKIQLARGQFIWGREEAAKLLNTGMEDSFARSPRTWETYLGKLEAQGMVTKETGWRHTRITIVNYSRYQHWLACGESSPDSQEKMPVLPRAESQKESRNVPESADPLSMYQQSFAAPATDLVAQSITAWTDTFKGKKEIVAYAIQLAGENGAKSPKYFEAILKNWHQSGVAALTEAKRQTADFEAKRVQRLAEKNRRLEEQNMMAADAKAELPKVSLFNWLAERNKVKQTALNR